jgi:hypothetical protein
MMRVTVLYVAALFASLGLPARLALACDAPSVPIYPGAQAAESAGSGFIATTAPLVDIQAFYYTRLPNEGWAIATLLPGQYAEQHDMGNPSTRGGNVPQSVLEFTRNNDREHVRIVGVGGGYAIYVDCRD